MSRVITLSIVVCTYNNAASLRRTLQSIAALLVPDGVRCECCVIDNNSSDNTRAIFEQHGDNPRITWRYEFEGKQGLSHARNRGIEAASNDFLIFTDDDVVVPADWLQGYIAAIVELDADAVFGRIVPEWSGPAPSFFRPALRAAYALLDYGSVRFVVKDRWHEFYGANFGCSRAMLRSVGGFNVELGRTAGKLYIGEEREVFLALLDRDATVVYIPGGEVRHVIAENRKNKAFLRRYFVDIATSQVSMAERRKGKTLWGIPLFKIRECAVFYLTIVPVTLYALLRLDTGALFVTELRLRTMLRTTSIYFRRALGKSLA